MVRHSCIMFMTYTKKEILSFDILNDNTYNKLCKLTNGGSMSRVNINLQPSQSHKVDSSC